MASDFNFEEFLTIETPQIGLLDFSINLLLTVLMATLLAKTFIKYGSVISNREAFAQNLVIVSLTTMVIITIVKSSLALSLGLVGALSIVRFRTPIKEPEELSYLFICIAIGLGMGAGQRVITVLGLLFIFAYIAFRSYKHASRYISCLHLSISIPSPQADTLSSLVTTIEQNASSVFLRRVNETSSLLESDFQVEFENFSQLESVKQQVLALAPDASFGVLDNRII